jgi:hypothetical protein
MLYTSGSGAATPGLGLRPEQVTMGSELLFGPLRPLTESSCFELKRAPFLPALDEAEAALFETLVHREDCGVSALAAKSGRLSFGVC